jgi:hypothetical protein
VSVILVKEIQLSIGTCGLCIKLISWAENIANACSRSSQVTKVATILISGPIGKVRIPSY